MVTVFRADGMRFMIFVDDHEPAHVHVYGDGEAKIKLIGPDGSPELIFANGMKFKNAARPLRTVGEQQEFLLGRWRRIHG